MEQPKPQSPPTPPPINHPDDALQLRHLRQKQIAERRKMHFTMIAIHGVLLAASAIIMANIRPSREEHIIICLVALILVTTGVMTAIYLAFNFKAANRDMLLLDAQIHNIPTMGIEHNRMFNEPDADYRQSNKIMSTINVIFLVMHSGLGLLGLFVLVEILDRW